MFYGDTIQDTRAQFFNSWEKYNRNEILTPLETQIAMVIAEHPEYHAMFNNPEKFEEISGEANPFLHLGLHLAIREQISTNRPFGIIKVYEKLLKKYNNALEVEHVIMEILGTCLWEAQRAGIMPDEQQYLVRLQQLV